jgi:hypothetical protein
MRKELKKMKVVWIKFTIIGYLVFSLMACTEVADPNVPNDMTPLPSDSTPTTLVPPQQGDSTPMPPDLQTPAASGLENLIEQAKQDLAQRLTIPTSQITLVEATAVEWSDSSLGCPQPGMEYLQVITPGYRILLEAGGTQYEYHSNRDAYVVYCENMKPPTLPKP